MQSKVIFLQISNAISDRQLEERLRYDLSWKKFVGFSVDYFRYDHSTVGKFRERLGQSGFKSIHDYILAQIIDLGLIDKDEATMSDATHSYSRLSKQGLICPFD